MPAQIFKNVDGMRILKDDTDLMVTITAVTDAGPTRNLEHFLNVCKLHRPKGPDVPDRLFLRPLGGWNSATHVRDGVWFTKQPIGKTKFNEIVRDMFNDAGIAKDYKSHCFRRTKGVLMRRSGADLKAIGNKLKHAKNSNVTQRYTEILPDEHSNISRTALGLPTDLSRVYSDAAPAASAPALPQPTANVMDSSQMMQNMQHMMNMMLMSQMVPLMNQMQMTQRQFAPASDSGAEIARLRSELDGMRALVASQQEASAPHILPSAREIRTRSRELAELDQDKIKHEERERKRQRR